MAEVANKTTLDLIANALDFQEDLIAELFHNIISRSDQAEVYGQLLEASNKDGFEGDRQVARLERIRLANTVIANYITREF